MKDLGFVYKEFIFNVVSVICDREFSKIKRVFILFCSVEYGGEGKLNVYFF